MPRWFCTSLLLSLFVSTEAAGQTQPFGSALVTRSELIAAAAQADTTATRGDPASRAKNAVFAAAIHQRLRDGDVQVGDRVVVTIASDAVHRDTVVVRSGRILELPGMIVVPVAGVLRSELQERVSTEVLKYVKAQRIEVTLLMRVGVLGAVARPGYFAFPSDIPLTDVIMGAGGPSVSADVQRSTVRRANQEYRSVDETRKAIAGGLTLDQFGLNPGDELVVGNRRDINVSMLVGMAGALASLLAVFVTLRR